MIYIRKVLFFILATFIFIAALLAAADNSDAVSLRFLEWESPAWPVSWWMLMAFVIGVIFGSLLNLYSNTRLRMNARAASKTAESRTRELDEARANTGTEMSGSE